MTGPRIRREIKVDPESTYFKPRGIPMVDLEFVELAIDELEALRLKNIEKLNQEAGAAAMRVSRGTFQQTLYSAYEKITDALVNSKAIKINQERHS